MRSRNRYGCPSCLAVFRSGYARCPLDGAPLQVLQSDPLSGSTFEDRYVIEECVGEGGMGRVYRARHKRVSRRFAVKVLFGDRAAESKAQERFAREAEAASRLSHLNVVPVVDFGETEHGIPYLVMDWVEGRALSALIFEEAPFERDRVIRLLEQLAGGLAHAHDKGLVHRDFKSENVIVGRDNGREVPKIVDFGIAMIAREEEEERARADARLTTEGMVMGTPAYMAPEQATDETVDHRCDLFALGVLAYEMLSGSLPFDGQPAEMARQNMVASIPPISERVPGLEVDPKLEAVAVKLMAKRPKDRYQDAWDVAGELEGLGREAEKARPKGAGSPAAGPAERTQRASSESLKLAAQEAAEEDPDPSFIAEPQRARRSWMVAGLAAGVAALSLGGVVLIDRLGASPAREVAAADAGARAAGKAVVETKRPGSGPAAAGGALAGSVAADRPNPDRGAARRGGRPSGAPARSVENAGKAPVAGAPRRGDRREERAGGASRPEREARRGKRAAKGRRQGGSRQGEETSPERLQRLYERVGREIAELHERRGAEVSRRYEERYLAIPFASAIHNQTLNEEVYQRLVRLRKALRREYAE